MTRLWLTGMTSAGNEEDLREMIEPIKGYLDGVVYVTHRPCEGDGGAAYLESVKGAGKVIYRDWVFRHDYSQNETLYADVIEEGDLVIICDTLERPAPGFVSRLKAEFDPSMIDQSIDCLAYYGKPFVFRYNEYCHYEGSPHWGLRGVSRAVELSQMMPDESQVRYSVRGQKRGPFHWVAHYLKYFVSYPAGSNHALLGLDHHPGRPEDVFPRREAQRLAFRREMKRRGYPLTVDGFVAFASVTPMDATTKTLLNSDKVWSDAYWYLVKGDTGVIDSHKPSDARRIE